MLFDAPLAEQANPGLSPNPTKAPWYFMGIQEILMHFHPLFAALVIPSLLIAGLLYIPYIPYEDRTQGVWFCSKKGRSTALLAAATAVLVTVAAVLADDLLLSALTTAPPTVLRNGQIPWASAPPFTPWSASPWARARTRPCRPCSPC